MIPPLNHSDDPRDESTVVDPEIVLISDYLSRELSLVEMARVEDRLGIDLAFRAKVQPLLDVEALSQTFSSGFGIHPERQPPQTASEKEIAAGWQRFEVTRLSEAGDHRPTGAVIATIGGPVARRKYLTWRVAAGVTILLGAMAYLASSTDLLYGLDGPPSENVVDKIRALFDRTTITSGEGETRRFVLSNGSAATLSPASRLVYRSERRHAGDSLAGLVMSLRGEAVIDVSPNTGRVFLGTPQAHAAFTPGRYKVRALHNDTSMLVAVEEGSVTVLPRGADTPQHLLAGQSATVMWDDATLESHTAISSVDSAGKAMTFPVEAQGEARLVIAKDLTVDGSKAGIEYGNDRFRVSASHNILIAPVLGDRVTIVSADGKRIQVLAPNGNNPGEFRIAQFVGWVGNTDSLFVGSGRRVIIYGPDLKFAREFLQPAVLHSESLAWVSPPPGYLPLNGMFSDGSMLLNAGLALPPAVNVALGMDATGNVAPDGKVFHLFVPNTDAISACNAHTKLPNGQPLGFMMPLCGRPSSAYSTGAEDVLVAPTSDPGGNSYRIIKLARNGDTVYNKVFPSTPLAVTQRERDSVAVANERAADPAPSDPKEISHFIDSVRRVLMPKFFPTVLRVVAGIDGTAWIELATREVGHLWMILDPSGVPIGQALFPPNVKVSEGSRSVAWGIERGNGTEVKIVRFTLGSK